MQNLPRFGECRGRVAVAERREAGDQITRNLDADSDSITVANGGKRLLNLATEMEGDPVCSLSCMKWTRRS